ATPDIAGESDATLVGLHSQSCPIAQQFPRVMVRPVHLAGVALTNRTIQNCRPWHILPAIVARPAPLELRPTVVHKCGLRSDDLPAPALRVRLRQVLPKGPAVVLYPVSLSPCGGVHLRGNVSMT